MEITKEWLKEKDVCSTGLNWFITNFSESADYQDVLNKLAEDNKHTWAKWLIARAGSLNTTLELEELDCKTSLFFAGDVIIKKSLKVKYWIITGGHIEAGKSIEAEENIKAGYSIKSGEDIEAGKNIEAGWYIEAGKNIKAGYSIKSGEDIEAGWSIKAGEDIEAGWSIKAGENIEAGKNIKSGDDIKAGYSIKSGEDIEAGWSIKAGENIEAGWSIKAGENIEAGWSIKAGDDFGVYAGIRIYRDQPVNIKAKTKPNNIICGKY